MKQLLMLFLFLTNLFWSICNAESVAIIINDKNNSKINIDTVHSIYNDIQFEWSNGKSIMVFELPLASSTREIFSSRVLGLTAQESQTAWNNRKITNILNNRPKIKRDKLVLKNVARNTNAIGYVDASLVKNTKGVRVVLILEK